MKKYRYEKIIAKVKIKKKKIIRLGKNGVTYSKS